MSLPSGAQSAVKAVKNNFDYLNAFDEVVICTDMDAASAKPRAIAEALPVGKASIATLPEKDANEALLKGKAAELIQAVYRQSLLDRMASSQLAITGTSSQLMKQPVQLPGLTRA